MTTNTFSSMPQIAGTKNTEDKFEKCSSEINAMTEVSFSHVVTIRGYSKTRKVAPHEYLRSSFTAAGHGWSILYYPRGHSVDLEDGKYISLYLHCTDEDTDTDVKAQSDICLLDRAGMVVYTRDTGPFYSRMCGVSKFIKRRDLENSGHLHDDGFRIQFDVTVLKLAVVPAKEVTDVPIKFVDVPPSDIFQRLGDLLSSGDGMDVMFEVDGESFRAHRSVLAARSPVFRAELFSPMKEGTATCVWVEDMEPRVFSALLHFIYNDELPPLMPEVDDGDGDEAAMVMVQHMLVAADRYCLERMKLMCEEKLCGFIDKVTVGTMLELADQHGCCGLEKACLSFLKSDDNLIAAQRLVA